MTIALALLVAVVILVVAISNSYKTDQYCDQRDKDINLFLDLVSRRSFDDASEILSRYEEDFHFQWVAKIAFRVVNPKN
jgi:hypothetical protein